MTAALIVGLLWKSGVVAGAGLLLSNFPGFRAAADRVAVAAEHHRAAGRVSDGSGLSPARILPVDP